MEENKKDNSGECECQGHEMMHGGMHSCCGGGKHMFLRCILGIVIIMIVLTLGIKLGEMKSIINGDNYSMRGNGYYGYSVRNNDNGMMTNMLLRMCGKNLQQSTTTPLVK